MLASTHAYFSNILTILLNFTTFATMNCSKKCEIAFVHYFSAYSSQI